MRSLRLAWLSFRRRGVSLIAIVLFTAVLFGLIGVFISLESTIRAMSNPTMDDRAFRLVPRGGSKYSPVFLEKLKKLPRVSELAPVVRSECVNDSQQKVAC